LRPVGKRGPRNPGGGVCSRRRLSIRSYAPSPAVRRRLPLRPGGRTPTASWSSSQQSEDEVDVTARLAWTRAASRRATASPTRSPSAPPPGTVTGDPACRAHAGRLEAEIRRPSPFDKITDAAGGSGGSTAPVKRREAPAPAPQMLTAAAHRQATGAGRQPLLVDNYVTYHVDNYVIHHLCCREKVTGPPGPGYVTTGLGSLDMRQRNRYLVRRGAGGVNSGSGEAARPAAPMTLARRARKRRHRTTNTLKLPFAATPRPLQQGRNCHAQRDCDDRIRTA
jgi:hypothetical protein